MKLYVGNLPFSTTDDDLKELFSAHGHVSSARVVIDRASNRSRGFGFVEFEDAAAAQEAIAVLHGKEFGGRTLVVNEARPEGERGGGRGHGGGRGGFGGDRGPGGNRGFGGNRGPGGDRGFGGDWGGGDWGADRGPGRERRERGNRKRGAHGGGRGRGSGGRDDY